MCEMRLVGVAKRKLVGVDADDKEDADEKYDKEDADEK